MASKERVPRVAKRRTNAQLEAELTQARAERDEAVEYQAAISDVLKVIARPTSDLQPVLDTLLTAATRLSSGDSADSDGSRPGFRNDFARHSDLMSLTVPI